MMKITSRITRWTVKHLSHVGTIQLVNSILRCMYVNWCYVFIFPKAFIEEIDKSCRIFLWNGGVEDRRGGSVAWAVFANSSVRVV